MTSHDSPRRRPLGRRDLLIRGGAGLGAAAFGAPALAGGSPDADIPNSQGYEEGYRDEAASVMAGTCVLTPDDVQGPFWLNLALLRQDITEGMVGMPLTLYIKLVDASDCSPISGAVVDVWHDDPEGRYSGFAVEGTAGQTWLRGIQLTGLDGLVRFDTIYPGWYTGRTPHVHVKINPTSTQELTTQLYFDDDVSRRVYELPPYDLRGPSPTTNATDAFFQPELLTRLRARPGGGSSLICGMRIGI